ncbi:MAG: hypothetical protein P4M07_23095 [Xanthobacteraceae bacterium]|nr:hypothetical protein [Xanthobacteraceae bacterium]
MRRLIFSFGIAAVLSTTAAGQDDCRCWTPNAEQIAGVEKRIMSKPLPLGSLDRYARYYAGVVDMSGDRKLIRGKLVPLGTGDPTGIHVVEGLMPPLQQEGCVISSEPRVGTWIYFRCARPGAWTPSDAQTAELQETVRRNFEGQSDKYARHYAGVTEGDHKFIVGVFVARHLSEEPRVYVASEAELPLIADGGCGVVRMRYDPSNKQIEFVCNPIR